MLQNLLIKYDDKLTAKVCQIILLSSMNIGLIQMQIIQIIKLI